MSVPRIKKVVAIIALATTILDSGPSDNLIGFLIRNVPNLQPVTAKEVERPCQVDNDCTAENDYYVCDIEKSLDPTGTQKYCQHKKLFPMKPKEWVGTFVFSLIMLLSNIAGIGGGGIAVPLAMYFFNLSMKPAIAVSSFSIMFATLARFFFNFNEKHPEKANVVVIDYGMTNVMMPLTMLGSVVGAYIYLSFPDLILMIVLTLLLLFLAFKSGQSFIKIYRKENEILTKQVED